MEAEAEQIKIQPLMKLIMCLIRGRFWGQITIKFKDGAPVLVHQEQQIKLD